MPTNRTRAPLFAAATAALLAAVAAVVGSEPATKPPAKPGAKPEARPVELKTFMCKRGDLLLDEPFTEETWKKNFRPYKGNYVLEDGAVKAAEVPADNHHPAAPHTLNAQDAIVQFRFKFDGATWIAFAFDEKEHVARVWLTPNSFKLFKMTGIGPTTKSETIDEKPMAFEPGKWYTLLIEIRGREMLAQIDGQALILGEREGIDLKKVRIELISGGQWAWFDDLKIWEALPDDTWAKKKPVLLARREAEKKDDEKLKRKLRAKGGG